MIKITSQTTQKEIINSLLSGLSTTGNLYMHIISLPYFLSSLPSIKIFQYKIQNYPRQIFWFSHDPRITNLMSQSDLSVGVPPLLEESKISNNTSQQAKPQQARNSTVINLGGEKATFEQKSNINNNKINANKIESEESKTENSVDDISPIFPSFSKNNFTAPINFSSSSVLQEFREKHLKITEKTDFKQDLNQWLEKIESTKSALSKFQSEAEEQQQNNIRKNRLQNLFQANNFYKVICSTIIVMVSLATFMLYPTNNYKLEIEPMTKQEALDIKIPDNLFNKTTVQLKTSSEIDSSGIKESIISTDRSNGKVALINNSPSQVEFEREGIILISESNGLEYRHKSSEQDPKLFAIKSKNAQIGEKTEIDIQGVQSGDQFNLPLNSIFKVYNMRGEAMGSNFKAVAISEIKNTVKNIEKIVSEDDLSLLRSKVQSNFLEEKSKYFQTLKDQNQVTNANWVKSSDTKYEYSSPIGSNTKKISVIATTTAEILSLPKDTLTATIQSNSNAKNVSDITIVETKIDQSQVLGKFFVSYTENPDIIKDEISNKLKSNADFDLASADLQVQYPSLKRVSKNFQGIPLPLVSPRNKIEINQLQEK